MSIIVLCGAGFGVAGENFQYAMSFAGKTNWQSRPGSKDDAQLAERLKKRDPDAMADLYDRYGRTTYSLIFRIVRDTAVAEDLVQETFLRVWNRMRAFDAERGALGPWLLTVARNRALDYVRSVAGRMSQCAAQLEEMESPGAFAGIEQDVLNIDRVRLLKDAFTKLNSKQREVIELAYYEGLSQSEMAKRMQQPLGTVKAWARSALKILREQLGQVTSS